MATPMPAEWEWMTDAMKWKSYSPALSAAIEAGYQAGNYSVNLGLQSSSVPTHSITFQHQPPCQINEITGRIRSVRRRVLQPSGVSEWQWWEDECDEWHSYDATINSQIEFAWGHSDRNGVYQANAPAGFIIYIHRRKYTIQFEADGVQTNLTSHYSRKVRRRLVPAGAGAWVVGTVPTHQASGSQQPVPAVPYDPEDLQPYNETSDNDCPICVNSLVKRNAVKLAKCRHTFCKECIMRWFETRPTCPICTMAYGLITGMQPLGTMHVRILPAGSPEELQGYPNTEIIQIFYNFPNGIQGLEHPSPGQPYTGTHRVAYLPKTKEGEEVLSLLRTAWDRRLLFRVGTSVTTGRSNVVTWSGVHHKTSTMGGSANFGYPDDTYFARVKAELAELGVK